MEFFQNPAVIWFIAGFIFFVLEFLLPGFILFFFGVAAWLVALLLLMFDIPINVQLLIFLAGSIGTTLLLRRWMKDLVMKRNAASELEDEFVGKLGRAETAIAPDREGKVAFKGTTWAATSDEMIAAGEQVIITGNDSITLIVKSTKSTAWNQVP